MSDAKLVHRVAGLATLLIFWEVLGQLEYAGGTWPPLSAVGAYLWDLRHAQLLAAALQVTATGAVVGLLIGSAISLGMAIFTVVVPATRGDLFRFAAIVNAVPVIVVAPILIAVLPRDSNRIVMAAASVFFTTFVAATSGFDAAPQSLHDVVSCLGASRLQRFRYIQLPAAIPLIIDAFKLGVPAALMGAILGEWLGADKGIGAVTASAMLNIQIDLLWSATLLTALASAIGFGAFSLLERSASTRFGNGS